MMQNITLFLGDNASGKTRILKNIIREARKNNQEIVTNITGIRLPYYERDIAKYEAVCNVNNDLIERLFSEISESSEDIKEISMYDRTISDLLSLIYAKGKILILDSLDAALSRKDLVYVCMIISEVKSYWKQIYISGFHSDLLRLFTTIDYENDTYETEHNVYSVQNCMAKKLMGEEIIAFIDSIW